MRIRRSSWLLVLLAGCASGDDPPTVMQVSGATGTYAGLNHAQNCACSLEPLESNHRHFALNLKCMDGTEVLLETGWGVWQPVRNQRLLIPTAEADFGRSVMEATLGSSRIDPRGAPFDDHVVFPLYVHLLRDGYEHPQLTGAFSGASLPVTRGELRDAVFWCEDPLGTTNIDHFRRPDAGT